ncbi:hypothetical protein BDQ17DRAFT_1543651 [Cyathus striatus]|nr:hypothetical protein BDQ17DRAFT_1543651 [Cyathus striatus]
MPYNSGVVDEISLSVTLNYVSTAAAASLAYDIVLYFFDEATTTITVIITISQSQNQVVIPGFGCGTLLATFTSLQALQTVAFSMSLALHITLFLLTIRKARLWSISREHGRLANIFRYTGNEFPLLTSVSRDGTLYFFILFVSTIPVAVAAVDPSLSNKVGVIGYVACWYIATLSYLGSRLILNLRKLTDTSGSNENAPTLSRSIFFAQPGRGINTSEDDSYVSRIA